MNATKELTIDLVKETLDNKYELVYVEYNDSLDGSEDKIQAAIQAQDICKLDECVDEWWLIESQDASVTEILKQLKEHLSDDFGEDDVDNFLEDKAEEIRDIIYERDTSTPLDDLLRHTNQPVCFYDTGVWVDNCEFDGDLLEQNLKDVKRTLHILMKNKKYDAHIDLMIQQAYGGGRLVVYFRDEVMKLVDVKGANIIHFKNPMIAVINMSEGSGDNYELEGHEFDLPFNPENLFLDKTFKYSYTYAVCGMSEGWCDCTDVSFKTEKKSAPPAKSELHALQAREDQYNQVFKAGGCIPGDMDIHRHRNTYYLNDPPCGTHCPHCGTFWID